MARRRWRLSTTLVLTLVALFLAVTAATAVATVLITRAQLTEQIDAQLREQARIAAGPQPRPGGVGRPAANPCEVPRPGVGEGMLQACQAGTSASGYVVAGGEYVALSAADLAAVLPAGTDSPTSVTLEAGEYRVLAAENNGTTVVTGIPLAQVDQAIGDLEKTVLFASLTGAALTVVGGVVLVRRALRPLVRVAATARGVSEMDLSRGEVHLPDRVEPALADGHTEVGQVGRALNSLLDNVGGALAARQRSETRLRTFVADASHELRTPLAAIRGYAELSRRQDEPVPDGVRHGLDRIESEATRMTGLVEDLLLLARLDAGRKLEHEEVELSLLVMEAVSDAHAMGPDHRWELDLPDDPVAITGDGARIHQVLANLLGNARNHTPPGTRVVTSLRQEGQEVVLTVADDGPGIPEALQGELFERFTRGDAARHRGGGSTGLGLSISKAIVEAHGGTIAVSSAPGRTEFTVRLPAG